ncbi:DUF6783 domain-containing protein [Lachnospiraceae bacterium 45-P1]
MWAKYTAKWGVQMTGMNFQTHSRRNFFISIILTSIPYTSAKMMLMNCPSSVILARGQ